MRQQEALPPPQISRPGHEVQSTEYSAGLPHTAYRVPHTAADLGEAEGPCPNCGARMNAIRGSKHAICANCGFKDSCCF